MKGPNPLSPGIEALRPLMRLPGVGKSLASDLWDLGYRSPDDLAGEDPEAMYQRLMKLQGAHIDRCVLYVFRAAVHAVDTRAPEPKKLKWWDFKG